MALEDKRTNALRPHLNLHVLLQVALAEMEVLGLPPQILEAVLTDMQMHAFNPQVTHQNVALQNPMEHNLQCHHGCSVGAPAPGASREGYQQWKIRPPYPSPT